MIVQPQVCSLVGQFLESLQTEVPDLEIMMLLAHNNIPACSLESLMDASGTQCQFEEHIFI